MQPTGPAEFVNSSNGTEKQQDVRTSNIMAAKGIFDLIRTSLGPRGLDKMITTPKGDVLITNDGATIMKQLEARHPTARMLVELSQSQDIEAGDGTTSVVVLAGSILSACLDLFKLGIHPSMISEGYQKACDEAQKILLEMARPVDLNDHATLCEIAKTTLSSKVISHQSATLAPIVVDSVLRVRNPDIPDNVDLRRIRLIKKVGGTLEDCCIVNGICFPRRPTEGPTSVQKPKIGLIRFHLSPPKTDMDSNVVVSDDAAIERLLDQERKITLKMCKKVAKTGCNVLLVQKSVLREAVSDMALHYLKKLKITVIDDIERNDMEYISDAVGAVPVATLDEFTPDKLGSATELKVDDGITYILTDENSSKATTCTILIRGANKLIIDECERSIHDALCSIRCLVKKQLLLPGGGAVETEISRRLHDFAEKQLGMDQYCVHAYADAFEVIPLTLAENAGLNPIHTVTELRRLHTLPDNIAVGINIKGDNSTEDSRFINMFEHNVVQPFIVNSSAINLATETARMLLKIDDIVLGR